MKKAPKKRLSKSKKNVKMPGPDAQYGHTKEQIKKICKLFGVDEKAFWDAFGINTVAIDDSGKTNYYTCDIEKALFSATNGKWGINHVWD